MPLEHPVVEWLSANWVHLVPFAGILLTWILATRFPTPVKLRYGRANNSFHTLYPPNAEAINVYCEKLYVQNAGVKPATQVEVAFSNEPTGLSTYPPLKYTIGRNLEGQNIMTIESIAPRELVVLDTIHVNARTAEIVSVRSSEGVGKAVNFWVVRRFDWPVNLLVLTAMVLGAYYALFLMVSFISIALTGAKVSP